MVSKPVELPDEGSEQGIVNSPLILYVCTDLGRKSYHVYLAVLTELSINSDCGYLIFFVYFFLGMGMTKYAVLRTTCHDSGRNYRAG